MMYRIIIVVLLNLATDKALSHIVPSEQDSVALYSLNSSKWNGLLDSILRVNDDCRYLNTNPVFYGNVYVRAHGEDTLVSFSFVQHSPNMYIQLMKPNLVFIRNGIRFYVRYTDVVERFFVKKYFIDTGRSVIWRFSDSIYPHYSVGHINVVDGLTVEAKLSNDSLVISRIIYCETD